VNRQADSTKEDEQYCLKFPEKRHALITECERDGLSHVISFEPCGKAFAIHQKSDFMKFIIPDSCFRTKKYISFKRQLETYGFKCTDKADTYYNRHFERDCTANLHRIRRCPRYNYPPKNEKNGK
jgi:HSF-type DNA-binding